MTKAITIINQALLEIKVKSVAQDLQTYQVDNAIFMMNSMMFSLDALGVKLGYSQVNDKNDELTSPIWADLMLYTHLAIASASRYGKNITPALAALAGDSMDAVDTQIVSRNLRGNIPYPPNLPTGAGNQIGIDDNQPFFYHDGTRLHLTGSTGTNIGDENSEIITQIESGNG